MKEISLHEIYEMNFDVLSLAAFNQKWTDGYAFEMPNPRKCSGFLYFENCDGEYVFDDGTSLLVKKGEVAYIPKGSTYKTLFYSKGNGCATTKLIEFDLKKDEEIFVINRNVFVVVNDEQTRISEFFAQATELFSLPVFPVSAFKAELFSLIHILSKKHRHRMPATKEFNSIATAVRYLENNTNIEKSVAELAKMCYMSETYFRSLFKKCLGMSPAEYCIKLKVSNAKRLLKGGFYSVAEVSEMLGFKDSGYFNKVFKKHTGKTPGKYK